MAGNMGLISPFVFTTALGLHHHQNPTPSGYPQSGFSQSSYGLPSYTFHPISCGREASPNPAMANNGGSGGGGGGDGPSLMHHHAGHHPVVPGVSFNHLMQQQATHAALMAAATGGYMTPMTAALAAQISGSSAHPSSSQSATIHSHHAHQIPNGIHSSATAINSSSGKPTRDSFPSLFLSSLFLDFSLLFDTSGFSQLERFLEMLLSVRRKMRGENLRSEKCWKKKGVSRKQLEKDLSIMLHSSEESERIAVRPECSSSFTKRSRIELSNSFSPCP